MPSAPTPTEAEIQKMILQWLRLHGAWVIRLNGGAMKVGDRFIRFSDTRGAPDILCCWQGKLVGIECKRKGGKASPDQLACIDAINRAGGVAFVARGIEDVEQALRLEGLL